MVVIQNELDKQSKLMSNAELDQNLYDTKEEFIKLKDLIEENKNIIWP